MKICPDNFRINAHAGFSLVDVMVGMVIALLGVIIIFQVFSVSEGIKRTTTSGGDALQNGASAMFALERSFRQAGYGVAIAPGAKVVITPGAVNTSDSIAVSYMPNWDFGSFLPNATNFPSAVPAAGALTTETLHIVVTNNTPRLVSTVGGVDTIISEGIVLLKAEIGDDANGDGVVDMWTQGAPANPLAVRIAVVARSVQPEKPSVVGGPCDTTTPATAPTWIDSATVPLDLSGKVGLDPADDWKCYRYKKFESAVPLRN